MRAGVAKAAASSRRNPQPATSPDAATANSAPAMSQTHARDLYVYGMEQCPISDCLPNAVRPAIAGRRTRSIEVIAMTDPASSENVGPPRSEGCIVAELVFQCGVSWIEISLLP